MKRALVVAGFLAAFVAGQVDGRAHAPQPRASGVSWEYAPSFLGGRPPGMPQGFDLIVWDAHGRDWTAKIQLRSCKKFVPRIGWPPCPPGKRTPDEWNPPPPHG